MWKISPEIFIEDVLFLIKKLLAYKYRLIVQWIWQHKMESNEPALVTRRMEVHPLCDHHTASQPMKLSPRTLTATSTSLDTSNNISGNYFTLNQKHAMLIHKANEMSKLKCNVYSQVSFICTLLVSKGFVWISIADQWIMKYWSIWHSFTKKHAKTKRIIKEWKDGHNCMFTSTGENLINSQCGCGR